MSEKDYYTLLTEINGSKLCMRFKKSCLNYIIDNLDDFTKFSMETFDLLCPMVSNPDLKKYKPQRNFYYFTSERAVFLFLANQKRLQDKGKYKQSKIITAGPKIILVEPKRKRKRKVSLSSSTSSTSENSST